jgi:hypothetical protein
MEGPERMGAGPESTGIEIEQLQLFDEYERYEIDTPDDVSGGDAARENGQRLHAVGHRPDHHQSRGHYGVRGDRLEFDCSRRRGTPPGPWTRRDS